MVRCEGYLLPTNLSIFLRTSWGLLKMFPVFRPALLVQDLSSKCLNQSVKCCQNLGVCIAQSLTELRSMSSHQALDPETQQHQSLSGLWRAGGADVFEKPRFFSVRVETLQGSTVYFWWESANIQHPWDSNSSPSTPPKKKSKKTVVFLSQCAPGFGSHFRHHPLQDEERRSRADFWDFELWKSESCVWSYFLELNKGRNGLNYTKLFLVEEL